MRKLFGLVTLLLVVALGAFAKDHGSKPGSGAGQGNEENVQSGYAVITPSGGVAAGLVAFETFGLHGHGNDNGTAQAGVLPAGLTTNALLFVQTSGRLSRNLGVAIVNPNSLRP